MDPNPHPKCSITACDGWAMPNESLNICITHAVTAWEMVETSDQHPYLREQLATTIAERDRIRAEHRATIRAETAKEIRSLDAIGEVYFVRVNGLIKVGWSSNLYARLRAYGPTAELLVCYDGTKRTEADLHRQLTPARAKGREWYHDGDIVNMFLDQAIEQHGSPPFRFARWTTHDGATPGKTKRLGY